MGVTVGDEGLFAGRVAIVTGGAGAIGGAICEGLARGGAAVAVVDKNAERLRETHRRLRKQGCDVLPVRADLTRRGAANRAVQATLTRFGRVDVLVNGVGEHLGTSAPFEATAEAQWQALYEVNLLTVLRMTHAVLPAMLASGWGRIVNFSSVEGIRAAPWLAVYSAFKRAVDGFTKSLAVDVARHGILVNAIAVDKTRAFQVQHYALPAPFSELAGTWIPAGHYAAPEEVAEVALFLASPRNTWVVGQTIVADGGTLSAGGWYRTPRRWTNQPLMLQYFETDAAANDARPPSVR